MFKLHRQFSNVFLEFIDDEYCKVIVRAENQKSAGVFGSSDKVGLRLYEAKITQKDFMTEFLPKHHNKYVDRKSWFNRILSSPSVYFDQEKRQVCISGSASKHIKQIPLGDMDECFVRQCAPRTA